MTEHTDLIARLETAETGSRELDIRIHADLRGPDAVERMRLVSWYLCTKAWEPPAYTTSLDAKLPGENIVHMFVLTSGRYVAWHTETQPPNIVAEANTEPLARRAAAMKAMQP